MSAPKFQLKKKILLWFTWKKLIKMFHTSSSKPSQANLAKHLAIQHLCTRRAYRSRPGLCQVIGVNNGLTACLFLGLDLFVYYLQPLQDILVAKRAGSGAEWRTSRRGRGNGTSSALRTHILRTQCIPHAHQLHWLHTKCIQCAYWFD